MYSILIENNLQSGTHNIAKILNIVQERVFIFVKSLEQ